YFLQEEDIFIYTKFLTLPTKIDNYNTEKENYAFISNISMEFVQAHTTGDMDRLRQLLSDDIVLEEKDNKLYAKDANGDEWLLFNYEKKIHLDDWVIQGYEYDPKSNTFQIFIREFYTDLKGEPEIPPTFLHLSFIKFNEEWKIASIEFDV
ncbi:nuclear transport factor 2 family protein, partial [Paenibacillus sp. An7]|uniref:nuclear transport factor 2 family protein n=1 Tax=Paenibacillus sp. An7 TaxID=2689577 RepID=UPI001358BFDB